jgi:hypothetical protein
MRFESLEELIVYFVKGDRNVQDYDIEMTVRPEAAPAKDSNDEVEPVMEGMIKRPLLTPEIMARMPDHDWHGQIFERPDGIFARCMGSSHCDKCLKEVKLKEKLELESKIYTPSHPQVKLTSLTGINEMDASLGDENILYVDSYEAVKDYCGTGKINVFGKTLVVNMCEMDNVAQTKMSIDINGVYSYNVDFKLRLLSEKPEGKPVIQLKETLLDVDQT